MKSETKGYSGQSLREVYVAICEKLHVRKNSYLVKFFSIIPNDFSLVELDLNLNFVGRVGIKAVFEVVRICPNLKTLCIADNFLNNESVSDMVSTLTDHPGLRYIDLSRNPISHAAGKALSLYVTKNPGIHTLLLSGTLINPALIRIIERKAEDNASRARIAISDGIPADSVVSAAPVETMHLFERKSPASSKASTENSNVKRPQNVPTPERKENSSIVSGGFSCLEALLECGTPRQQLYSSLGVLVNSSAGITHVMQTKPSSSQLPLTQPKPSPSTAEHPFRSLETLLECATPRKEALGVLVHSVNHVNMDMSADGNNEHLFNPVLPGPPGMLLKLTEEQAASTTHVASALPKRMTPSEGVPRTRTESFTHISSRNAGSGEYKPMPLLFDTLDVMFGLIETQLQTAEHPYDGLSNLCDIIRSLGASCTTSSLTYQPLQVSSSSTSIVSNAPTTVAPANKHGPSRGVAHTQGMLDKTVPPPLPLVVSPAAPAPIVSVPSSDPAPPRATAASSLPMQPPTASHVPTGPKSDNFPEWYSMDLLFSLMDADKSSAQPRIPPEDWFGLECVRDTIYPPASDFFALDMVFALVDEAILSARDSGTLTPLDQWLGLQAVRNIVQPCDSNENVGQPQWECLDLLWSLTHGDVVGGTTSFSSSQPTQPWNGLRSVLSVIHPNQQFISDAVQAQYPSLSVLCDQLGVLQDCVSLKALLDSVEADIASPSTHSEPNNNFDVLRMLWSASSQDPNVRPQDWSGLASLMSAM